MRGEVQNPRNESSRLNSPLWPTGGKVLVSPRGLEGSGRDDLARFGFGRWLGAREDVESSTSRGLRDGWGSSRGFLRAKRAASVSVMSPRSIRVSTDWRIRSRFRVSWSTRRLPLASSAHVVDTGLSSCLCPTIGKRLFGHRGTL